MERVVVIIIVCITDCNDQESTNSGGGSGQYKCVLCPQQCSRKSSLLMHYTLYHKVHGISKTSCCNDKIHLRKPKFQASQKISRRHGLQPDLPAAGLDQYKPTKIFEVNGTLVDDSVQEGFYYTCMVLHLICYVVTYHLL